MTIVKKNIGVLHIKLLVCLLISFMFSCYKTEVIYTFEIVNSITQKPEPSVTITIDEQTAVTDPSGKAEFMFGNQATRIYMLRKDNFKDVNRIVDTDGDVEPAIENGGINIVEEKTGYTTNKKISFYIFDAVTPLE